VVILPFGKGKTGQNAEQPNATTSRAASRSKLRDRLSLKKEESLMQNSHLSESGL